MKPQLLERRLLRIVDAIVDDAESHGRIVSVSLLNLENILESLDMAFRRTVNVDHPAIRQICCPPNDILDGLFKRTKHVVDVDQLPAVFWPFWR